MTNTNLGLMLDAISKNEIDSIINFFRDKFNTINDIIVFSKDPLLSSVDNSYGVLSLYYFKFYRGIIVFFSIEDYLEYREYSLSKDIYLYLDDKSMQAIENIDRNMIKNITILVNNKGSNSIEALMLETQI